MDASQRTSIDKYVQQAEQEGAEAFQASQSLVKGCFIHPLSSPIQPVSTCVQEEVSVL